MKEGFNPLEHGYNHYLGLPESNAYGCTDSQMGDTGDAGLKSHRRRDPMAAVLAAQPRAAVHRWQAGARLLPLKTV